MSATMTAPRTSVLTRTGESHHARDSFDQMGGKVDVIHLEVSDKPSTSVPPDLVALIEQVLRAVTDGDTVTIGALPAEMTTTQTAEQLGVSRPMVTKLIHWRVAIPHSRYTPPCQNY